MEEAADAVAAMFGASIPRCWCTERGWQIIPGEHLCESGHIFTDGAAEVATPAVSIGTRRLPASRMIT